MRSGRDYTKYWFTLRERVWYLVQAVAITIAISFLFYDSFLMLWLVIPFYPIYLRIKSGHLLLRQKRMLEGQFKEAILCVATCLNAGYSIENSWKEAAGEIERIYGAHAMMSEELLYMTRRLSVNVSLETLLEDFAMRSGSESIESFCQIFLFAKRGGGDFLGIIQTTANVISEELAMSESLEAELAAKRMEARIMDGVPLFILGYIRMSSPDYFNSLYHNPSGIGIMSVCLVVYLLAYWWSEKLMNI